MKTFVIILLIFFYQVSYSQTQYELTQASCEEFKKAENTLKLLNKKVIEMYVMDTVFVQKFKQAQEVWLQFRKTHIETIFPKEDKSYYGNVFPMCHCIHLLELTQQRIRQVEKWTEGIEEGDVCGGSRKIKEK